MDMIPTAASPPEASFGDLLRGAGLQQNELAARLHVIPPAVGQWARGESYPTIDRLPALAEALGVGLDVLVPALIRTRRGS